VLYRPVLDLAGALSPRVTQAGESRLLLHPARFPLPFEQTKLLLTIRDIGNFSPPTKPLPVAMPSRRNLVFELAQRRTRHLHGIPRYEQTKRRLYDLEGALYFLQRRPTIPPRHKRELYRYFPVALVAIAEGHFKMLYRDLIDSGEPFLSRAKSLRDIKLDIDSLIGVHQRSVTIGELISQQLPHSSMAHIDAHMSMLLSQDFPKEFQKRVRAEDATIGGTTFQTHMRRLLEEIFRQRHVYCHELATTVRPRLKEVSRFIKVFRVFVQMIEEHVQDSIQCAKA
jgi:hypothetical protein